MELKDLNNKDKGAFIAAIFTVVGLVSIYSLSNCFLGSQYSIYSGDFWGQYVPFVKSFISKIFEGGAFSYSFSNGLGDGTIANFSYFSCISPFTLIFFLIDDVMVASYIVVLTKYAVTSAIFYLCMSKVFDKRGSHVVLFSTAYALGNFALVSVINIHFMDAMYILPLVIICLHDLLCHNKKTGLTLVYAYTFINCFYTGYVVGIFSFLAFILALIFFVKKADAFKYLRSYVICVITAILISGVVILPTAAYILNHLANDANSYEGMKATPLDVLASFFALSFRTNVASLPFFYCGLPVLLAVPAFFLNKDKASSRHKIIAGVLLLIVFVSTFVGLPYLFWHCMDSPDGIGYRFGYLLIFLVCAMGAYVFEDIDFKTSRISLICLVLVFLYMCQWYVLSAGFTKEVGGFSMFGAMVNIALLLVYTVLMRFKANDNSQISRYIFLIIFFIELVFNGVVTNSLRSSAYSPNANVVECMNMQEEYLISNLPDDSLKYRVYQKNASPNVFSQYDINGIGVYFTTFENPSVRTLMHQLGYMSTPRVLADYGSTPIMQMLLSEKYAVAVNGITVDTDIDIPVIETNDYALSMGYLVDESLLDLSFDSPYESINPFENQNKLLMTMTGMDEPVFVKVDSNIKITSDRLVAYDDDKSRVFALEEGATLGSLTLSVTDNEAEEVYAYLTLPYTTNRNNVPSIKALRGDEGSFMFMSITTMPHVLKLLPDENGVFGVDISVAKGMEIEGVRMYDCYFYKIDNQAFDSYYNQLAKGQLQIDSLKDGYISASIEVLDEDQLLFFSIPYDEGWSLYVDGDMKELVPVINSTFMAAKINQGSHQILLKYNNRYIGAGMIFTIVGLVLLFITIRCEKKEKGTNE